MSDALRRVVSGLRLTFWGIVVLIVAVVVAVIGTIMIALLIQAQGGGVALIRGLYVYAIAVAGLVVIGKMIFLIGQLFCLAVPSAAGTAKTFLTISVGMGLLSAASEAVTVTNLLVGDFLPPAVAPILEIVQMVLFITSIIFFIIFLRKLAEFIGKKALAKKAMTVLWLYVGTLVFYIPVVVVQFMPQDARGPGAFGGRPQGPQGADVGAGVAGCSSLIALVFGLIGIIQCMILLSNLAKSINNYARNLDNEDDDYRDKDSDIRTNNSDLEDEDYDDRRGRDSRRRNDDHDDDDIVDDKPWKRS